MRLPWNGTNALRRSALALTAAGAALLGASCFTSSDGLEPPQQAFYFPTGVLVSPGGTALYVVNSDFDLQYNGGTVQALDLAALRGLADTITEQIADGATVASACQAAGLARNPQTLLHPGPCSPVNTAPHVKASATIGAFASGAVLLNRLDGPGARLFIPVRGDPSITYLDVADDRDPSAISSPCGGDAAFCLSCGAASAEARCAAEHRVGENPYLNIRGVVLPPEPVGIAVTPLESGDAIVAAHQTEQSASLVVNTWASHPTLEFFIQNLSIGPTEVAGLPVPELVKATGGTIDYRPGFLVTYREAAELTLLRYEDDARSSPDRPFLTRAGGLTVQTNSSGDDSRGIAVDGAERRACELSCAEEDLPCLERCLDIPLELYVANRAPASLLIGEIQTEIVRTEGEITGATETVRLTETVPLTFGASKVEVGHVVNRDGELERRVFAVAFDTRFIFSYDPAAHRIDHVIRTGRGPHDIGFDASPEDADDPYAYLVVGHFTDSYLGFVDLDMRNPTFGSLVLTVGPPVAPRDSE